MLSDKIITKLFLALLLLFFFAGCASPRVGGRFSSHSVSPYDYGLSDAKNGVERYNVLLKAHQAAVQLGVDVSYKGIKKIEIEIPKNAVRIPLTDNNDFSGCEFVITNKQKTVYLFESISSTHLVSISKSDIDSGDFQKYKELSKGNHVVLIEDKNPWVANRRGYSYGHMRRDILLVKDGKAKNRVVMPYDNEQSNPVCSYLEATPFSFKNLTVQRTEDCTAITNVMFVSGRDNVEIINVNLHTPYNEWRNDRAIRIEDCTNVHFKNVLIDGTYSQQGHSGYGISLNTIWNFTGDNIVGHGNWGIFGTNNMNGSCIENSAINRFDIHCYGRDVTFKNVDFSERYNQLASVYGIVSFDNCTFTNFDPLLNGGSYNAYVEHDIYFNNCIFNVTKRHCYLIKLGLLDSVINSRKELEKKCWPNIHIKNLTVNLDNSVSYFVIMYARHVGDISNTVVNYLSDIDIEGMAINAPNDSFRLFMTTPSIQTANAVNCKLLDVFINGKSIDSSKGTRVIANMPLNNDKIEIKNTKGK